MHRSSHYDVVARRILRALRGKRSQVAFARRLGFSSNVAAKWESGQRMPTGAAAFRHSHRVGIDVALAGQRFHAPSAAHLQELDDAHTAAWLEALRGNQRIEAVAARSGLSRFSVGRFLSGASRPSLPQLLTLVDAMTMRLADFVHAWVGLEHVPELRAEHARLQAARRVILQEPCCLAVMCLLDTQLLREESSVRQLASLARTLDRPQKFLKYCLASLVSAGVVQRERGRYTITGSLTIDARADPATELMARDYWAKVSAGRAASPATRDLFSYNVFSVSRADYEKLRDLQREFYRGARALIASSEPTDVAGLLVVHLLEWDPVTVVESDPNLKG